MGGILFSVVGGSVVSPVEERDHLGPVAVGIGAEGISAQAAGIREIRKDKARIRDNRFFIGNLLFFVTSLLQ